MGYGCNTAGVHLMGESKQESLIWNFWWAVHFTLRRCAWPPHWSDLSPPDNILWRVCKPRISEQLKSYTGDTTAGIVEELQRNVTKNLTARFYSNIYPTRCNFTQFVLSENCSTCFGWYLHPSSGAQTTVSTASRICHTVTVTCH
jgi:hypothetical protein